MEYNLKKIIFTKGISKYIFILLTTILLDAISIFAINQIFDEKKIVDINPIFFMIIIASSFSYVLQPILIYEIAKKIRENIFSLVYNFKDLNYHSLEYAIQKDEMVFLNLIVSDISIGVKLFTLFTVIFTLLITSRSDVLIMLIFIPVTVIFYRKLAKEKQDKLAKKISLNFHDITEIRKAGSVLSKAIYFNKSNFFMNYIDKLYSSYYKCLAMQNSLSSGYRTVIEISAYLSILVISYTNIGINILKSLIVIGYSLVKVLPVIQQLNFYINVRQNGKDQLGLIKSANMKFKPLDSYQKDLLYTKNFNLIWIRGKSGTGKTTLMDCFANDLKLNKINFGYYVQNQYPLKVDNNRIENLDWVPKIDSIKSILEGRYSIGEIQRLAILDIISNNDNKVILLDEPFSSQSDGFIKSIVTYLKGLVKNGSKIILISHLDISQYFENYQEIWCNYDRNNSRTN